MNVTLVLVQESGKSQEVPMKRARLVIGRQKGVDLKIPVPAVSREHCELRVENGSLTIRDLGSSNGTYVNRSRVQDGTLKPGDLLAVGPAVFVVRIDGEPTDIDAEDAYDQGASPKTVVSTKPGANARPSDPAKVGSKPKKAADEGDPNDSSISGLDFDFLNEDDQPKL